MTDSVPLAHWVEQLRTARPDTANAQEAHAALLAAGASAVPPVIAALEEALRDDANHPILRLGNLLIQLDDARSAAVLYQAQRAGFDILNQRIKAFLAHLVERASADDVAALIALVEENQWRHPGTAAALAQLLGQIAADQPTLVPHLPLLARLTRMLQRSPTMPLPDLPIPAAISPHPTALPIMADGPHDDTTLFAWIAAAVAGDIAARDALFAAGPRAVRPLITALQRNLSDHGSLPERQVLFSLLVVFDDPRSLPVLVRLQETGFPLPLAETHYRLLAVLAEQGTASDIPLLLRLLQDTMARHPALLTRIQATLQQLAQRAADTGDLPLLLALAEAQRQHHSLDFTPDIGQVLVQLAQRSPRPELRAALPLLRPARGVPNALSRYYAPLETLLSAAALPIPAQPDRTANHLPIPANPEDETDAPRR